MPTVQRIIRFIWNLEDKDNNLIKFLILKSESSKMTILRNYMYIYIHVYVCVLNKVCVSKPSLHHSRVHEIKYRPF